MKRLIIVIVLMAASLYLGTVIGYNLKEDPVTKVSSSDPVSKYDSGPPDAQEILELINEARKKEGIQALSLNASITNSACEKTLDMIGKDYWSHNSPQGKKPWAFLLEAGVSYQTAGENLLYSQNMDVTSREAFDSWMSSPGHRQNIMAEKFDQTGICFKTTEAYQDSGEAYVGTQHFITSL